MKNKTCAMVVGALLSLAGTSASYGMSEFVTLSFEPVWPTTPNPGTVIVYNINAVMREGQGMLEVALSSVGLPDGAAVTFSPNTLRFTGRVPDCQTATMTITCTNLVATDNFPFTITGAALRQSVSLTNVPVQTPYSLMVRPPVLLVDRLAGGSLKLRGQGSSGVTYQIESTPSLSNPTWTPVGSSTADGNGRFTYFPPQTPGTRVQFYRAVGPAVPQ